jgi:hypothetical protein
MLPLLTNEVLALLMEQVERLPPEVRWATADELIEAGYGEVPRAKIPKNWRELDASKRAYQNKLAYNRKYKKSLKARVQLSAKRKKKK